MLLYQWHLVLQVIIIGYAKVKFLTVILHDMTIDVYVPK